jgi:subtilisin family serine protease
MNVTSLRTCLALLALVLASATLSAREFYYWTEGQTYSLVEDRSSVALHFHPGSMPDNIAQAALVPGVIKVDVHPYHGRAILHLDAGFSGSAEELAAGIPLPEGALRSAVFGLSNPEGTRMWLTHEVVLIAEPGVSLSAYTDLLQRYDARFSRMRYQTTVLDVDHPLQALELANAIQERGGVLFSIPDFYSPISYADPLYANQFQMNNTGQVIDGFASVVDIDVNAPEAWAVTTGDPSMIVAVVDDGVNAHEDLQTAGGASRVLSGLTPATGGNGAPIGTSAAHGVACAGIVAASHNSIGVRGVAPQVQLLPVNIFAGGETTQDLADAITFAKNSGAAVITNSWGYPGSCSLNYSNLTNAINDAALNGRGGLGCVVVFAAGNSYGTCVDYPAYLSNVIAVGAVTNLGTRSSYSNRGTALDVVAPSNPAPGQSGAGVRTTDRMGTAGYASGNYTNTFGGTSAACPVVAGVAALVLDVNPSLTGTAVRERLTSTATDMGAAGFDNDFGFGRVNAFAAVTGASAPTVSVSGTVRDAITNAALGGVQVRYDGPGGSFSTATDASGNYSLSGLIDDGFYLVYLGRWGHQPTVDAVLAVEGGSKLTLMQPGFGDHFEFNLGWSATGTATTGAWVRGIPIGTELSGAPVNPGVDANDQGPRCFVTGNGGGSAGTDDVDDGIVTLTSPVFDLSGTSEPYISYARWFYNGGGSSTPNDNLQVRLSNGSTTVVVETVGGSGPVAGAWVDRTIRVSDFITPTANMRIIVETSDLPGSGHLVEGGFDKFRAFDSVASAPPCVSAPSGLASLILANGVSLSWNSLASEGAISYTVSGRRAGTSTFRTLPTVFEPLNTANVNQNRLVPGWTYEWKVQATCSGGVTSPESALGVFTWPALREAAPQAAGLMPNPASDHALLYVESDGSPATVRILDMAGRSLMQQRAQPAEGYSALELNLSGLEAGIYLVEWLQGENRQMLDLVITR